MMTGESPQDATANYADDHRASPATNPIAPMRGVSDGKTTTVMSTHKGISGTIFEAAFVDPAYTWPPAEGQGKNAIELQASTALMKSAAPHDPVDELDDDEISLTPSMMSSDDEGPTSPRSSSSRRKTTPRTTKKKGGGLCCKSSTDEQIISAASSDLVETPSYNSKRSNKIGTKAERRAERQRRILAKKKKAQV